MITRCEHFLPVLRKIERESFWGPTSLEQQREHIRQLAHILAEVVGETVPAGAEREGN